MTRIKVTYRAQFQFPKDLLNPGGFKLPAPVDVELFVSKGSWAARAPHNKSLFEQITPQPSAATAKQQMTRYFEKLVSDWEVYDAATGAKLDPEKLEFRDDGVYLKEMTEPRAGYGENGEPPQ